MPNENRKELMEYRLDSAEEKLTSAKALLDIGNFKDSIGRSYYAMFSSVRALLALEGVDYSKHAGVIAHFQKEYIKTGVFDKKYSTYISQAFKIRNSSDYEDFFLASQDDAVEQYKKAEEFYNVIHEYLLKNVERKNSKQINNNFEEKKESVIGKLGQCKQKVLEQNEISENNLKQQSFEK